MHDVAACSSVWASTTEHLCRAGRPGPLLGIVGWGRVQDWFRLAVTRIPADRLDPDAQVDEQVIDLPAGTTAVFHVTSRGLDPEALVTRPVLRTENDLVRTAG
jgi:hypothetical protein